MASTLASLDLSPPMAVVCAQVLTWDSRGFHPATVGIQTTFLTADPDFVTGMASAFSIRGNFYEFSYSESEKSADARAIGNDWQMVGQDVKRAMVKLSNNEQIPCPRQ
ncbi:MAG: hypothetical protein LBK99_21715 [Opitutaceae bacterium]|jgi:hypothetical protein|nr:hypothetical protein [Opitutaceae bacterium]